MTSYIYPGRLCLSASVLTVVFGAFYADWNETHVFNPRWPPHAKFHNGQTISLGICLCLATLYYAWRDRDSLDSLRTAVLFGSFYPLAGLAAAWFPGSAGRDPEFGGGNPQRGLFAGLAALSFVGYWLEARRVKGQIKGGKVA